MSLEAVKRELGWHKWLILGSLVVMLGVQLANALTGYSLNQFGIHPRSATGIVGVLFAPLLHGSFMHLAMNASGWLILGWMIVAIDIGEFVVVTLVTWLSSGLGAWAVGDPKSVHVGASGIIFGFLGFLLARGIYRRSVASIATSLFVGSSFGMMIFGVLPNQAGISWECHLFGFLGGIFAARLLHKKVTAPRSPAPR